MCRQSYTTCTLAAAFAHRHATPTFVHLDHGPRKRECTSCRDTLGAVSALRDLVLLCANNNPAVAIVSQQDGRQLPMFLPGDGPFDHGLLRQGYVVTTLGYQPVAVPDGQPFYSTAVPKAWRVVPSVNPKHILIDCYRGRSKQNGEANTITLLDQYGNVLRTCESTAGNIVGELTSGELVAERGFFTWDGRRAPTKRNTARAGEIIAVVAGRYLLTAANSYAKKLVLIDTQTDARVTVQRTTETGLYSPVYNIDASCAAFASGDDGVLIVDARSTSRPATVLCHGLGFTCYNVLWLHDGSLLAIGNVQAAVIDLSSGGQRPIQLPKHCHPVLDVTDRLSIDTIAASILPARNKPLAAKEFATLQTQQRERLHAAATQADILPTQLLRHVSPGIRLRTVPTTKTPALGQSCFGGRPAMPEGTRWPIKDGVPYTFFAQLRCDELRAAVPQQRAQELAIPTRGWIVIFIAIEPDGMHPRFDADSVWATYVGAKTVKRIPFPRQLDEQLRLPCVPVSIEPVWTLPDCGDATALLRNGKINQAQLNALHGAFALPAPQHQLFGYKFSEQGFAVHNDQELLLQLDSDGLLDVMFGDGGRLHVFKPKGMPLRPSLAKLTVELDCG